jgi:hypothetical protein
MSSDRDTGRTTRFEAYPDYSSVSRSVAKSVDDAIDAYSKMQSRHAEGARVTADQAAEGSAHILSAALTLLPELEDDRESVEEYDKILNRWQGENGYIERLKRTSLGTESPEWLGQFIVDIRRAGFQLGYLKAGTQTETDSEDVVERDVESMFE